MEPRFFEGEVWIGGMPGTAKFRDLVRDRRFCLHTATIDTQVKEGDAKVWGTVEDVMDEGLHQRYAQAMFEETGFDIRGQKFDHFFQAHLSGASKILSKLAVNLASPSGSGGPAGDARVVDRCWQVRTSSASSVGRRESSHGECTRASVRLGTRDGSPHRDIVGGFAEANW